MKQKKTIRFMLSLDWDFPNELWIPVLNLHTRINHRGSSERNFHIKTTSFYLDRKKVFTKEQKRQNYESLCLENCERPYHFTDDQWEAALLDIQEDRISENERFIDDQNEEWESFNREMYG